jgi:2,3-bisphosphoglycerate-dependent phosphoglycerate mutase
MTKATLVLLRHGQTEFNVQKRFTGQIESPLTKDGEAQASAAGVLMKDIPFDKVYSSPLSRAFNTAALALKAAGQGNLAIEKEDAIIESDSGDFSGRHRDDPAIKAWKWIYNEPMPNGESDKEIVARVKKFFDAEVQPRLDKGENVLLVAHSGILKAFDIVLGFEPVPADNASRLGAHVPNAAPLVCDYEDGVMKSHRYIQNPASSQPASSKPANENKPPRAAAKKVDKFKP